MILIASEIPDNGTARGRDEIKLLGTPFFLIEFQQSAIGNLAIGNFVVHFPPTKTRQLI